MNMLKKSTTHTYYLLKVTKLLISPKMMRSTRIHWLQVKRMSTTVLKCSHVGTVVTQNHNMMIMVLFLKPGSMFLTQEVMVDASWIYVVISVLTFSTTQPSLNTSCHPWSLCTIMRVLMRINHTLWRVATKVSRFLGKLSHRIKITRGWTHSTKIRDFPTSI